MTYEEASEIVLAKLNNKDDVQTFIDPITMMMIASILGAIFQGIRLYCQWRQNNPDGAQILERLKNRPLAAWLTVRRAVREEMEKRGIPFKNGGTNIVRAILQSGQEATPEVIDALLANKV